MRLFDRSLPIKHVSRWDLLAEDNTIPVTPLHHQVLVGEGLLDKPGALVADVARMKVPLPVVLMVLSLVKLSPMAAWA